jgi:hypothetical protein
VFVLGATGGDSQDLSMTTNVFPASQLNAAGCVAELDGSGTSAVQVLALDVGARQKVTNDFVLGETEAFYSCSPSSCPEVPLLPGTGVGFTTGTEPHMITTSVDATGVLLEQVVLTREKSGVDHLVERSITPSASLPDRVVVGNFDADGQPDMVWDIESTKRASTSTTFEIAYARLVGTSPLEALSQTLQSLAVDDVLVDDVNGDGIDDIIVTFTDSDLVRGVFVEPMGVESPTLSVALPPSGSATCP